MSNDIETWLEDCPICPYCGHEHNVDESPESWAGDQRCEKCDKGFRCETDYTVRYSTYGVPCMNGEPHKYKEVVGFEQTGKKIPFVCEECGGIEWNESIPHPSVAKFVEKLPTVEARNKENV